MRYEAKTSYVMHFVLSDGNSYQLESLHYVAAITIKGSV